MSLGITLIVLLAAGLHASWNALLRAGTDRPWSITTMGIAIAVVCADLAPFVPERASWDCVLITGGSGNLTRRFRTVLIAKGEPNERSRIFG